MGDGLGYDVLSFAADGAETRMRPWTWSYGVPSPSAVTRCQEKSAHNE